MSNITDKRSRPVESSGSEPETPVPPRKRRRDRSPSEILESAQEIDEANQSEQPLTIESAQESDEANQSEQPPTIESVQESYEDSQETDEDSQETDEDGQETDDYGQETDDYGQENDEYSQPEPPTIESIIGPEEPVIDDTWTAEHEARLMAQWEGSSEKQAMEAIKQAGTRLTLWKVCFGLYHVSPFAILSPRRRLHYQSFGHEAAVWPYDFCSKLTVLLCHDMWEQDLNRFTTALQFAIICRTDDRRVWDMPELASCPSLDAFRHVMEGNTGSTVSGPIKDKFIRVHLGAEKRANPTAMSQLLVRIARTSRSARVWDQGSTPKDASYPVTNKDVKCLTDVLDDWSRNGGQFDRCQDIAKRAQKLVREGPKLITGNDLTEFYKRAWLHEQREIGRMLGGSLELSSSRYPEEDLGAEDLTSGPDIDEEAMVDLEQFGPGSLDSSSFGSPRDLEGALEDLAHGPSIDEEAMVLPDQPGSLDLSTLDPEQADQRIQSLQVQLDALRAESQVRDAQQAKDKVELTSQLIASRAEIEVLKQGLPSLVERVVHGLIEKAVPDLVEKVVPGLIEKTVPGLVEKAFDASFDSRIQAYTAESPARDSIGDSEAEVRDAIGDSEAEARDATCVADLNSELDAVIAAIRGLTMAANLNG